MAFDLQEKYIIETEKNLNYKLPSSYRDVMQESNGGTIEVDEEFWDLIPIADKSDKKRISRTCNNVITETEQCRQWSNFPEDALAIAVDGSGDYLIFKENKADNSYLEYVYLWSHETGSITKVAEEFKELDIE